MAARKPFVLLDNAVSGQERFMLFRNPVRTIAAENREGVNGALQEIHRAVEGGQCVAGYFAYELGYVLEPKLTALMPTSRRVPLLWFGVFETREDVFDDECDAWLADKIAGRAYAGPLAFADTENAYGEKFARVKDCIAAGDIYQANLTFPASFRFVGDPLALYRRLRMRARAGHGAYIDDGTRQVLSLSPELFFTVQGNRITARPMKGTAPRGRDGADDAELRTRLQASEKDRAENLMIVDLIRNDLGRVARTGSVAVENLFAVETYPTVHQMVSTVHADLRIGTTPEELVRALFPCGSITGAPKIRAMEIIRELEPEPRDIYCGAIGHFAPGGTASFNVAIRTITIAGNEGRLNVGGAVVADSTAHGEYEECRMKARYFTESRPPIGLIETLRFTPSAGFVRAPLHLERMARSADALGIPFDPTFARMTMEATRTDRDLRVRLSLGEDGHFACFAQAMPPGKTVWTYAISGDCLQSGDRLARFKTDWRELYDRTLEGVRRATGCDEVVFLNERSEIVEGSRTNVFTRIGGRLVTPPLSSGALDGCLRRELLDRGECEERVLFPADLASADMVYLGNSLRGLIEARPIALSR